MATHRYHGVPLRHVLPCLDDTLLQLMDLLNHFKALEHRTEEGSKR